MLELRNVCKSFGALAAVNCVSLRVRQGQLVGLIGPNGSGKSTLLNLIAGAQRADRGQILFGAQEITRLPPDAIFRLGIGRSAQDPSLFFRMSVLDNALLPVKGQRGERPARAPWHRAWRRDEAAHAQEAARALRQVNLDGHLDRAAADLSGGQMKLLELSRTLMGRPRLMLLDEPTAGVAPALALDIFRRIADLRARAGLTFLVVEHRLEILFEFVDSIYVMHMGGLIAQGTPAEIERNALVREIYFGE
jgi:branched-chain amino acid transport system ATP-binding protein